MATYLTPKNSWSENHKHGSRNNLTVCRRYLNGFEVLVHSQSCLHAMNVDKQAPHMQHTTYVQLWILIHICRTDNAWSNQKCLLPCVDDQIPQVDKSHNSSDPEGHCIALQEEKRQHNDRSHQRKVVEHHHVCVQISFTAAVEGHTAINWIHLSVPKHLSVTWGNVCSFSRLVHFAESCSVDSSCSPSLVTSGPRDTY